MPIPSSSFIDSIFVLIGENKLQEAVQKLQPVIKGSDLFYEVLHQSSRLSSLSKSIRQGTLDIESANVESNKIRWALLEITELLKDKMSTDSNIENQVAPIIQNIAGNQIQQSHSGSGDNVAGNKTVIFGLSFREIAFALIGVFGIAVGLLMFNGNNKIKVEQQTLEYKYLRENIHELENVFGVMATADVRSTEFEKASLRFEELRNTLRGKIEDAKFRGLLGHYFSLKKRVADDQSHVSQHDLKEVSDDIMSYLNQLDLTSLNQNEI